MDDQELEQLQDPANWDEVEAEVGPARSRQSRAVVSVAFQREDFTQIVEVAASQGMRTSEFIRKAALAASAPPAEGQTGQITSLSAPVNFSSDFRRSSQSVSNARSEVRESEPTNYSTS
jgi:hypothetical protein